MFDLFQIAFIGKLPRDVMMIIHKYCTRRYIIIYNTDNNLQAEFIKGTSVRAAIKHFLVITSRGNINPFYKKLEDIRNDIFHRMDEDEIFGLDLFVKNSCRRHIHDKWKYITDNLEIFVDVVYRYNDNKHFRILAI